jgi:D-lactate dehydrogenase (cytochrome)
MRELARRLASELPADAVSEGDSVRALHGQDESFHREVPPDLVLFPSSRSELVAVLSAAAELEVPVVPFGAGSSLEGQVIPASGGASIDLGRMNRILEVDPDSFTATVEPGVTRLELERKLAESGLMFPVDPGADATLGGMAATNAAGTMSARYGKMRPNVLALEAVLPGGRTIRTGSGALKTSAGYDLTGLLIGSEGTLAVISELTLRIRPIPDATCAVRITADSIGTAGEIAELMVATGIDASRIELLDEWEVEGLNRIRPGSLPAGSVILVELSGSEAAVASELADLKGLLSEADGLGLEVERSSAGQRELWRTRHDAMAGEQAMAPGRQCRSTDVCVPVGSLTETLVETRETIDRFGLGAGIVAHAADGNVHVGIMLDRDDPDEMRRGELLVEALAESALRRGGTCTGEHGIGLGKIRLLEREHGDSLDLMRAVKAAFDPDGIMNPGKVFEDALPSPTRNK